MKRIFALAIVCVAQFGCATVLRGTSDKVFFFPAADGMQVSEDGKKLELRLQEYPLLANEQFCLSRGLKLQDCVSSYHQFCLSNGRTPGDCILSLKQINVWTATIDGRRSHRFDIDVGDYRWHEQFDSKFNPWWLLADLFMPLFIGFAVDGATGAWSHLDHEFVELTGRPGQLRQSATSSR